MTVNKLYIYIHICAYVCMYIIYTKHAQYIKLLNLLNSVSAVNNMDHLGVRSQPPGN